MQEIEINIPTTIPLQYDYEMISPAERVLDLELNRTEKNEENQHNYLKILRALVKSAEDLRIMKVKDEVRFNECLQKHKLPAERNQPQLQITNEKESRLVRQERRESNAMNRDENQRELINIPSETDHKMAERRQRKGRGENRRNKDM